jgi:hypothetical protein
MLLKYAILIESADESVTGIWEQLTLTRGLSTNLFDHDADLLIFSTQEEGEAALTAIEAFGLPAPETMPVLLLPDSTDKRREFGDYGFMSHSHHPYVYANDVYVFILNEEGRHMQAKLALEQMEEHLLASFQSDGRSLLVTSNHSDELMQRIARAYQCTTTAVDV